LIDLLTVLVCLPKTKEIPQYSSRPSKRTTLYHSPSYCCLLLRAASFFCQNFNSLFYFLQAVWCSGLRFDPHRNWNCAMFCRDQPRLFILSVQVPATRDVTFLTTSPTFRPLILHEHQRYFFNWLPHNAPITSLFPVAVVCLAFRNTLNSVYRTSTFRVW